MTTKPLEPKVFDLGWCLARVTQNGVMTIVAPADSSEGFYDPAQTIVIARPSDIERLLAACKYALGIDDESKRV